MTRSPKSKNKLKPSSPYVSWEFEAIGTSWWLGVYEEIDSDKLALLKSKIQILTEEFDKTYSRFRSDSMISKMAKTAGVYEFPKADKKFFDLYYYLYKATGGTMTPLIGRVMSDAGYDSDYSLEPKELVSPEKWEDALDLSGCTVTVRKPVLLDFGAAGKGYLVDLVGQLLNQNGINQFCIDASGDMLARNAGVLKVGLENPDDPQKIIGVVDLKDKAICGSAGNRRAWKGYHHIMDPHKLRPVNEIKAVWVMAEDAMTADGLATALFFVGPEKLREFNFEYLLITSQNHLQYSKGLKAELFK